MSWRLIGIALCVSLVVAGCGGGSDSTSDTTSAASAQADASDGTPGPEVELSKGTPPKRVVVKDLRKGGGAEAQRGDEITIQYVGKRWDGRGYSNSWGYRYTPTFTLGDQRLPPGLVKGILGMKVGGRRQVIVPIDQIEYQGGADIHLRPQDTLVFVVDLVGLRKPATAKTARAGNVLGAGPEIRIPRGNPPKKLIVQDLTKGSGPEVQPGDGAEIRYVGVRWSGEVYSNTWRDKPPVRFVLDGHQLTMPGFEKGLFGMKPGGRRKLILPPSARFSDGSGDVRPANETLVYIVELIAIGDY